MLKSVIFKFKVTQMTAQIVFKCDVFVKNVVFIIIILLLYFTPFILSPHKSIKWLTVYVFDITSEDTH